MCGPVKEKLTKIFYISGYFFDSFGRSYRKRDKAVVYGVLSKKDGSMKALDVVKSHG
jgi:hypothetical protein